MLIYNRMIGRQLFYLFFYLKMFGGNGFIPIFALTKIRPCGATE